jgi:hypothetical protein
MKKIYNINNEICDFIDEIIINKNYNYNKLLNHKFLK